jgi:hypothetical protein
MLLTPPYALSVPQFGFLKEKAPIPGRFFDHKYDGVSLVSWNSI